MKNNEEFRASVFRKAAAYEAERKRKSEARRRKTLALSVCMLVAVPLLYIPINFAVGNISTAGSTAKTTGSVATEATAPTMGACGTTTYVHSTEAHTTSIHFVTTVPETTKALQTTVLSTTKTAEHSKPNEIGPDIDFVASVFMGKAQNTAVHKVVFKTKEEALAYNSGEDMVQFLEEFLENDFFAEFAVVGCYIEVSAEQDVYIKFDADKSGNLICELFFEKTADDGHNNKKALLACVGISKEWLEKGKEVIFIYE